MKMLNSFQHALIQKFYTKETIIRVKIFAQLDSGFGCEEIAGEHFDPKLVISNAEYVRKEKFWHRIESTDRSNKWVYLCWRLTGMNFSLLINPISFKKRNKSS